MVRHGAIYFVVYANSLEQNFLLIQIVLFENIKLLLSTNNIFIYCFRIIMPVGLLCFEVDIHLCERKLL